ncbi:hypothetical protein CBM2637_B130308 [Cupriavidus taiwanensis]|nr:hypothetical protein CBM2637_B130308 [Cupriavidus taiwanensis]
MEHPGQGIDDRNAHATQHQFAHGVEQRGLHGDVQLHPRGRQQGVQALLERAGLADEGLALKVLQLDGGRPWRQPFAGPDANAISAELRNGLEIAEGENIRREADVCLAIAYRTRDFDIRRHRERNEYIRIFASQVLDRLGQDRVSDRRDGRDGEPSHFLLAQLVRKSHDLVQPQERLLDLCHERKGFLGRLHRAAVFQEERESDCLLQFGYYAAHGRLGHAERIGACTHPAMRDGGAKRLDHPVGYDIVGHRSPKACSGAAWSRYGYAV